MVHAMIVYHYVIMTPLLEKNVMNLVIMNPLWEIIVIDAIEIKNVLSV